MVIQTISVGLASYGDKTSNAAINPGTGGSIKSSTVYCYTGDTLDKTVEYDENGIDTEQSQ